MAQKMQNGCTTPHMLTSENAVHAKFAELPFYEAKAFVIVVEPRAGSRGARRSHGCPSP
jgi:hypothetical protein